jgi:disulfide bond formation protein DsbB
VIASLLLAVAKGDVTDAVTTVLAVLALFVQVLLAIVVALALFAIVLPEARNALREVLEGIGPSALWLAFAVALVATSGSLFLSEYSNFIPCRLCWFQRIAMYPLVIVLGGAALRRDVRGAFFYGFPLAAIGGAVAIWHLYVEANPESESASCRIGAPCSTKWIDVFGYFTIPMLALTAFAAIIALLLAAWFGTTRDRRPSPDAT